MKFVDLAKEVLSEHDSLLSEWKTLNQLILKVREMDEKRPKSKESFYKLTKIFQIHILGCLYSCLSLRSMN
jgi:hypothetical protein